MATPEDVQKLLKGPGMMPPPGVMPNFDNPAGLHHWIIVSAAVCVSISTIAMAMRVYTKSMVTKFGLEDYVALLGWALWICYVATCMMIAKYGGGVHQWDVRLENVINVLYWTNVSSIMYGITMTAIKISILLQYMKLFVVHGRVGVVYWGSHIIIWSTIVFYIICTFFEIFACSPREKTWNVLYQGGKCFNNQATNIVAGSWNAFTDFAVLLLPQIVIWRLRLPAIKKLGASVIFTVGALACAAASVRVYYAVKLLSTTDFTYTIVKMGLWTWAEVALGIICSCMPTLPKFVKSSAPAFTTMASSLKTLLGSRGKQSTLSGSRTGQSRSQTKPGRNALHDDSISTHNLKDSIELIEEHESRSEV